MQQIEFRSHLPAEVGSESSKRHQAPPVPAMSATGARYGEAETRFGLRHLRAQADFFRAGGWSNRRELRVSERSFFRATATP